MNKLVHMEIHKQYLDDVININDGHFEEVRL